MIERLATSRKVSQRLKDLGVVQKSAFYWVLAEKGGTWQLSPECAEGNCRYFVTVERVSAYTCTEIAAALDSSKYSLSDPDLAGDFLINYITENPNVVKKINANLEKFWEAK